MAECVECKDNLDTRISEIDDRLNKCIEVQSKKLLENLNNTVNISELHEDVKTINNRLELGNARFQDMAKLEVSIQSLDKALRDHMEDELIEQKKFGETQKQLVKRIDKHDEKLQAVHDNLIQNNLMLKIGAWIVGGTVPAILAMLIKLAFFGK